jgi:hypothetical protein
MKRCLILSAMGWDCDLEYGHYGDLHFNRDDGFYAHNYDAEHHARQVKLGHADWQQPVPSDLGD